MRIGLQKDSGPIHIPPFLSSVPVVDSLIGGAVQRSERRDGCEGTEIEAEQAACGCGERPKCNDYEHGSSLASSDLDNLKTHSKKQVSLSGPSCFVKRFKTLLSDSQESTASRSATQARPAVCTDNLSVDVAVMKSAQDSA